tara:strand:- start:349 stop:600 length:252 start_codon:yes stop_codon:yes gene_type:complete
MEEPLYTAKECKAEIKRIQALIVAISAKPASASAQGAGSAHYMGRLSDLRKERAYWERALEEARAWELRGARQSAQGPKQVIE